MRVIQFLFLAQIVVGDLLQDQISQASIEIQQTIFDLLQSKSSSRSELVDPAKNWCCKIKPPIQAVQKTRSTTFYVNHDENFPTDPLRNIFFPDSSSW